MTKYNIKNNKILIILSLLLMVSTLTFSTITAEAPTERTQDDFVLSKTANYDPVSGKTDFVIEAFIKAPTSNAKDIIMVIDQTVGDQASETFQLKESVINFIMQIKENAESENVNHRISLLGLNAGVSETEETPYYKTEVLSTKREELLSVDLEAEDVELLNYKATDQDPKFEELLAESLLDVHTNEYDYLIRSAENIQLQVGTKAHINLGLDMANRVLDKIPSDSKREQVVVLLTHNGSNASKEDFVVNSNEGLAIGNIIKNKGIPLHVISVNESELPTLEEIKVDEDSADDEIEVLETFENQAEMNDIYLNFLSSNHNAVTDVMDNRTMDDEGYYHNADNTAELANIVESLAESITPLSTRNKDTYFLKDVVSEEFRIIENSVVARTQDYRGRDDEDNRLWGPLKRFTPKASINNKVDVRVKEFDYQANAVNDAKIPEEAKGKKLVLTFQAKTIDGFLGGINIETNTMESGIYKVNNQKLIKSFVNPTVDIIKSPEFKTNDVSMYLTNELKLDDLINVESKQIKYILDGKEYRINDEGIRNKHVDINIKLTDDRDNHLATVTTKGKKPADRPNYKVEHNTSESLVLKRNTEITHEVSLISKIDGEPIFSSADQSEISNVNVYVPEVTNKNKELYLGESYDLVESVYFTDKWCNPIETKQCIDDPSITAANNYKEPKVKVSLKLIEGVTDVIGKVYYPEFTSMIPIKVEIGPYNGKLVDIKDLINEPIDLIAEAHRVTVMTKELKIIKKISLTTDSKYNYLFDVEWEFQKDGRYSHFTRTYSPQVTLRGDGNLELVITDLPLGVYKITEREDWSWRSKVDGNNPKVIDIIADEKTPVVSFKNKKKKSKWIDDEVIKTNLYE